MGTDTGQGENVRTRTNHPACCLCTIARRFQNDGWFYTLWDFFIPQFSCPFPVRRIGTLGDGGKFVCGVERVLHRPDCVIYSLGVNDESSFEAALLSRSSTCRMYGAFMVAMVAVLACV
jgi:hypothetical protein